MPTPTNIQSEMDRLRVFHSEHLQALADQQYNTELTRSFLLRFVAKDKGDAEGLGKLLFAKGLRLLTLEPKEQADGEWLVLATTKRSLREITQEDFTCDLVTVACGVRANYEGWELLSEGSAEHDQPHEETPDIQQ